ncbi:MAG TPA: hypothetical protein DDZ83_13870 [Nitrospinae bacterium]|nr:hypothetical protein [Nitrospinota bacterium]
MDGLTTGQRVVVCNNISCGVCKYCRLGRERLCQNLMGQDRPETLLVFLQHK